MRTKQLNKIVLVLLSSCFVLLASTHAFALYISDIVADDPSISGLSGDIVRITAGPNRSTSGGDFNIDVLGKGTDSDFISFCVERDEYLSLGGQYYIESIEDFAKGGGQNVNVAGGSDPVADATKWVFWNYLNGGITADTASGQTDKQLSADIQNLIWFLEGEATDAGKVGSDLYSKYTGNSYADIATTSYAGFGNIKVLNIVNGNGTFMQSQLIADPVPEPATMLLFGTGLAGLVGLSRRKK